MTIYEWTTLPDDVLSLIAERLPVVDYIRFTAVCTSWVSVVDRRRQKIRPQYLQSPWPMLPGEDGEFSDTCTFINICDNRSYKVKSLPELCGKWWVGSTDGWVVTLDELSEVCLFNPLTRAQFQLPSITTFPDVELICNSQGDATDYMVKILCDDPPVTYSLDKFRKSFINKVVLSSAPTTTVSKTTSAVHDGFIAIALFSYLQELAFAKAGDDKWTVLDTGPQPIDDVIYHKGKFYSISSFSELRIWDLSGPSPKTTIILKAMEDPKKSVLDKYLVESSGDLLTVRRDYDFQDIQCPDGSVMDSYTTARVKVFKFDERGPKWIPISCLDDRCLFLGLNHSMSLSTRDIPELMPNCIYFTDYNFTMFYEGHDLPRDLGMFKLQDGSFEPYHPSDSVKNWPAPVWFMPNLS